MQIGIKKKYQIPVACGVAIRTDESLNRFRTIAFQDRKLTFKNYNWTTKIKYHDKYLDVYNFYPIYDWRTEDIWGAVIKINLKICWVWRVYF